MAIYELAADKIIPIQETSFEAAGLRERDDLQRLLKAHIEVVCPDVLVIAEEFSDWEDSRRKIDLLAVDKNANLVVIELKRTEDAGHAELQAIRYAAMVSFMTFAKAVEAFGDYLRRHGSQDNAETELLNFLEWEEPDEDSFAQDIRIVLGAANFSRELTTAVMWLNQRQLDIRCVRMRPYRDGARVLIDVQQVIPLPEAQDYNVRFREKEIQERKNRDAQADRKALRLAFWESLLERSSASGKTGLFRRISPTPDSWISTGSGVGGLHYLYTVRRHTANVQLAMEGDTNTNKARFDWLLERRSAVEQAFGEPLNWHRCDHLKKSYLAKEFVGGYRDEKHEWPDVQDAMIDAMTRLERALQPYIADLRRIGPDVACDDLCQDH